MPNTQVLGGESDFWPVNRSSMAAITVAPSGSSLATIWCVSMALHLSQLWLYPIKSCRGISVSTWPCDHAGLIDDRAWMVVDQDGKMITQRQHGALARVQVALTADQLQISLPGQQPVCLPRRPDMVEMRQVQCWSATCDAVDCGQPAAEFFSTLLQQPARLVKQVGTRPSDENSLRSRGPDTPERRFSRVVDY